MAFINVREFQCSSPPSHTIPEGLWTAVPGRTNWEVRPELWPFVSAFIVRRPYLPATLITVVAEVAILMENTNWRRGVELTWNSAAMSCSTAMSRFLTESLGLCIAVHSAPSYGWNPFRAILDADRLPTNSPLYVAKGSRPDFVAQTKTGWHGIEARGRSSRGPATAQRPIAVQKGKLRGMDEWSIQVGGHPLVHAAPSWSMTWSWITDARSAVDHFDPGVPVELTDSDEQEIWREMSERAAKLADVIDSGVHRVEALERQMSVVSRYIPESLDKEGATWLTVACWADRLTIGEVREWQNAPNSSLRGEASQELLGAEVRATMGSYMATAITNRRPNVDELSSLLEAIAVYTAEGAGMDDV